MMARLVSHSAAGISIALGGRRSGADESSAARGEDLSMFSGEKTYIDKNMDFMFS
jgi:hypothetical protein